ncbi:hypothetical protein Tco_0323474 [Tanacetum coccineum]
MVVAGMTAAAGGYEVEGGDVDDGGVGGGDGGVRCGGTAAGEEGEEKTRVRASEVVGWVDRKKRNTFGVRRKNPPENFSCGGDGGRRWLRVAGIHGEGEI